MKNLFALLLLAVSLLSCTKEEKNTEWIISPPAQNEYCVQDFEGKTVIPNGRYIQPYGKTIRIAPHPFGLVLNHKGDVAVTANSGTNPLSISIIRGLDTDHPTVQQVPEGPFTDKGIIESVYMGLAISPDDSIVYVAGGQANKVYSFSLTDGRKVGTFSCEYEEDEARDYSHGYIGDLCISQDGKFLYILDQIGFRMIKMECSTGKIISQVSTGRYPFGICLSPDGKEAYIANVGMYEYQLIPSVDPANFKETALRELPFAYQSKESIEGINTDSLTIPGLGDPNVPESFSVWTVDLEEMTISSKIKTGILVGEKIEDFPAVGGASPNSIVATEDWVFVSNGNNDCISVIDTRLDTVVENIFLRPDPRLKQWRGIIPYGLALTPDQKKLLVAESGINAIGIIEIERKKLLGHIPTGWFPSKLAVSPDGQKVIVANAKGFGSGPNGGSTFNSGPEGSYIGGLMKGSVSIFDLPDENELASLSKEVLDNNFAFSRPSSEEFKGRRNSPIPLFPHQKESPIKHIIFIAKENRTYDEVFGQLEGGKGEADLARFGLKASFSSRDGKRSLKDVDVMPNHLALARSFAISDNFYVDADHSADGHRWLAATYPNEWVETNVPAAYGANRSMKLDSKAPGALAMVGAAGAIHPEDYNEAGSLWEHMERNNIDFWNFGFGTMFAPHVSGSLDYMKGYAYAINYPVPAPIFEKTSPIYPTYNMAIPEQFRVDKFIEEFENKWLNGTDTMPAVLTIMLGNDHGAGDRPDAGFPFLESYMADNDLALGRIVEFISQTPYWKSTAIVVTEDDSQGGVDHIDAHRSLLMVISPYAKKNYIGHSHYSFGSIFKTFWNILGIPHLNQYDAAALDLGDLFQPQADLTPYKAIAIDPQLFDPQKAYDPLDEAFDWQALKTSPDLDDPIFLQEEAQFADQKRKN